MSGTTSQSVSWWEEKVKSLVTEQNVTIDVFVRSLCPPVGAHSQQERIIEQLQRYEQENIVDDVSVQVLGEAICPGSCVARSAVGAELLEKIEAIQNWSSVHGTETVFQVREVNSSITDESYTKLVPPRLCLLVATQAEPELVFPHQVDGNNVCISEFLVVMKRQTAMNDTSVESSV